MYKQAGFPPSNLGDIPQNHEQGASLNAAKGWNTTLCRLLDSGNGTTPLCCLIKLKEITAQIGVFAQ